MAGWQLTCLMPAMMRSLSSCFEVTRMWRRTEEALNEVDPGAMFGREGELETADRTCGESRLGFP
jgi:hypothetical protein